jgi:hypothetical protein
MQTIKTFTRTLAVSLGLILLLGVSAFAQTATTSTTLSSAITSTSVNSLVVASATNIDAGGLLMIDREALDVISVNSTTVRVRRGAEGTQAALHPSSSLVYVAAKAQKASVFTPGKPIFGTCTRANEPFLPQIDTRTGYVWDCPVGATVWVPINQTLTAKTVQFNLDNGAGTTIDAELMRNPRPVVITGCRIVYDDATTGTVAAGSAQVGTTVGGTDVVAATNYENAKAVGTTTAMVLVAGKIGAGVPVLVRHTGVATTQAGMSYVECDYLVR